MASAQRLLAGRQVARAAGQQRQPALQPREHRLRATAAGRGRPPARSPAAARPAAAQISATAGAFSSVSAKSGLDRRPPARRTARRPRTATSASGASARASVGQRQRRDGVLVLAAQLQRLPAGHQHLQRPGRRASSSATTGAAGRTCSKLSSSSRRAVVLQVVLRPLSRSGRLADVAHAEGLGDGRGHERRDRVIGASSTKKTPSAKSIQQVGGDLEPEAGLAGPARAGQGDQPDVVAQQQAPHRLQLALAPEQRRRLDRQVVRPGVERDQRREVGRQVRARRAGRRAPGRLRSLRRCSPRSTQAERRPAGRRGPGAAVASESSTCPPWPIPRSRAQRLTAEP